MFELAESEIVSSFSTESANLQQLTVIGYFCLFFQPIFQLIYTFSQNTHTLNIRHTLCLSYFIALNEENQIFCISTLIKKYFELSKRFCGIPHILPATRMMKNKHAIKSQIDHIKLEPRIKRKSEIMVKISLPSLKLLPLP